MGWLISVPAVVAVYVVALSSLHYLARWQVWDLQKMGSVPQALATLIGAIVLIVGWSVSNSQSIERDILTKRREQSSAVAEFAALVGSIRDTDDVQTYRRANQLSWQLFLWLPADVYRQLGKGLINPSDKKDLVDSLVAIRKSLLGKDAGTLSADDIIVTWPGAGRPKAKP
jgi:hypothetical protein